MTPLRIALPKGRLLAPSLELFARAGYEVPPPSALASRRLVFGDGEIEWVLVKDADVPVYVEHGGADAGIAGLDQILERGCKAYQPVELPYGRCRIRVIAPHRSGGIVDATSVATKYPRIARQFLHERGIGAEVLELSGSVELAAILRLTSHVLDLVETGETARANNLVLLDVVAEIAPRLVVNRDSWLLRSEEVRALVDDVTRSVQNWSAA